MNLRQMNWRTGALVLCLALSLGLSIAAYQAARQPLPDWIEIQEGPVAFGVDKFYRNAYFKGNIEVAGDLDVAGETELSDSITLTTAILDKLVWIDASGGAITSTRTLTPTATYYQVDPDAGGDITITLAACTTEGQPLILYNALTRTVTISSANALPSAPVALSQYDLYSAMCNGTGWVRSLTAVTGRNGETIINTPDGEWDFGSANLDTSGNIEGADFTASGAITASGNIQGLTLSISGDADVGTWLNLSLQATVAITEGSTITPTGTYQVITSSLAVTTSTSTAVADGGETGDVLILQNGNAAEEIIIDGTGANVECKSNVALGAKDILMLIWNGDDWNCLTTYDNS